MTRLVLWEGKGDWEGEWSDVLDTPLLPPLEELCEAAVFDDGPWDYHACEAPAYAWRLTSEDEGQPWPACLEHAS